MYDSMTVMSQLTNSREAPRVPVFFARFRRRWNGGSLATRVWYALLAIFIIQSCVLVFATKFGVPPDETNHIHFINYYTDHSLNPILTDQQPTYNLGDKTREVDYLYHYTMSLVRRVLPFSLNTELYLIRLFSIGFAVLTFAVIGKLLRRLGVHEWAITFSLALASLMTMVLMMSSAINNDVLVWLGLVLGLALLVRLTEKPRLVDLVWLACLVSYGGLVKRTLLPIGLVFALVGILVAARRWRTVLEQFRKPTPVLLIAGVLFAIGLGLAVERIGGNIVNYGHITPTCAEVQGEEACYDFWANIRERELAATPRGDLLAAPVFAGRWVQESFINIFDIQTQGWRHDVKPAPWVEPLFLLFVIVGLAYGFVSEIRNRQGDSRARLRMGVVALCVFYVLFHMVVNYGEYRHYRVFGLALNGRYILAGLLPLLGFLAWYWGALLRRLPLQARWCLAITFLLAIGWESGLHVLLQNPQLFHG